MRLQKIMSLLVVGASFALVNPALAQTTGGLSGQIVNASDQSPVADAVVIAQSPALQGEQTAVTDASGTFEITLLPAGTYSLTVQREGFQPFTQQGLTIRLDRTIKLKLALLPDQFQGAVVEIVAQKPVISVSTAQQGASVSKEQMNLVPYGRGARNFEAVITSVPGAHSDTYGVAINGAGSPESNYIIDGVQVNDPAYGQQGTSLLQDFVQEVDVKTGGYQAEYGRASGGIINVVTKSGGNEFHGSVFVNYSPYEAARKQVGAFFAVGTQTKQKYNLDFGAEVGGPILKDKLWFYAGFAPQLQSTDFDRVIQKRLDDGTGRSQLDSTGNPIVQEVARKTYNSTRTAYQYTGKLTYLLNENHTVALAAYGNPTKTTGGGVGTASEGASLADATSGSQDYSLRYSGKLLNKSMLVEAGLGYHSQQGSPSNPQISLPAINGVSSAQRRDTPGISWRSSGFAANTYYNLLDPRFNDGTQPDYQSSKAVTDACSPTISGFNPCPVSGYRSGGLGFLGNSTLNRAAANLKLSNFVELLGHHQFKYGIDGALDTFNQDKYYSGGQFFNGYAAFDTFSGVRGYGTGSPGQANAPLLDGSGRPFAFKYSELKRTVKNQSLAGFAQDQWAVLDRVTLDVGVRYEHQKVQGDAANTFDAQGQAFTPPSISLNNVMPRLGLIYDWTNRGLSKVYASYGRFYEYVPLDLADRSLTGEPSANYETQMSNCKNPQDPRTCALYQGGNITQGTTYAFVGSGFAIDPKLEGQYADEYQAGAQYQVYRDIVVGVDFVHKSLGRVIEDMSVDDGTTYFLSNPGEKGKLGYSATTPNGAILFPPPRRIYDAVTVSANKIFADNYFFTASYTYSSARGNYPGLFKPDTGQLDPNITSEYDLASLLANRDGPLPGDTPNSFKVGSGYVYEVDAKTSLQLGGNLNADQGGPTNYLGAHPIYGAGEGYILPRGSGNRLPWVWQLDLRAAANYKVTKDYALGVNVDLFNVTNNRQTTGTDENYTFSSVNPIVNGTAKDLPYLRVASGGSAGTPVTYNANFGQPTSYQVPFSARVGAKLSF